MLIEERFPAAAIALDSWSGGPGSEDEEILPPREELDAVSWILTEVAKSLRVDDPLPRHIVDELGGLYDSGDRARKASVRDPRAVADRRLFARAPRVRPGQGCRAHQGDLPM